MDFEASWIEAIGWVGGLLFIFSYILVSRGTLKGTGGIYNFMNLGGSLFFATYAVLKGALPILILEIVWGSIAVLALYKFFTSRAKEGFEQ